MQSWCQSQLPDFLAKSEWPSHSPDLNPMDFSVWSVLEAKIGQHRYATVDALKAAIRQAWAELSPEYLRATVEAVPTRLRACIRAHGDLFE